MEVKSISIVLIEYFYAKSQKGETMKEVSTATLYIDREEALLIELEIAILVIGIISLPLLIKIARKQDKELDRLREENARLKAESKRLEKLK